jgi:hypothetical protein
MVAIWLTTTILAKHVIDVTVTFAKSLQHEVRSAKSWSGHMTNGAHMKYLLFTTYYDRARQSPKPLDL